MMNDIKIKLEKYEETSSKVFEEFICEDIKEEPLTKVKDEEYKEEKSHLDEQLLLGSNLFTVARSVSFNDTGGAKEIKHETENRVKNNSVPPNMPCQKFFERKNFFKLKKSGLIELAEDLDRHLKDETFFNVIRTEYVPFLHIFNPFLEHSYCEKPTCCDCELTFANLCSLRNHLNEKNCSGDLNEDGHGLGSDNSKDFKCDFCRRSARSKNILKTHILTRHLREEIPILTQNKLQPKSKHKWTCTYCGYIFRTSTQREIHTQKMHTKDYKRYGCDKCKMRFLTKFELTTHFRTHSKMAVYECAMCPKRFRHQSTLSDHAKSHLGTSYKCEFCGKSLMTKRSIARHILGHLDVKSYVCGKCGNRFVTKHTLLTHMRTHTGARFQCGFCGKEISEKRSLAVHIRTHTGEKPFRCLRCPLKFHSKRSAIKHTDRVHREDSD